MRKPKEELEHQILEYITKRVSVGIPPTVREMCDDLGIKSTSTAHKYMKILESKGHIKTSTNLNRSIRLAKIQNVVHVPLVGQVAAGTPILAVENITDYIPFHATHGMNEDLFALKVRGDSMINAAILEDDIIICNKTSYANNGEIVVAMVEDEATVKRFFKENGHYRLQPENDSLEPIILDEVSILGKVISVVRIYQ